MYEDDTVGVVEAYYFINEGKRIDVDLNLIYFGSLEWDDSVEPLLPEKVEMYREVIETFGFEEEVLPPETR